MASFSPFKAILPDPGKAKPIASPPYDVMSTEEAREMVKRNAESFLRVTRSEVDLPESVNPYSPEVYQKARSTYDAMKTKGSLRQDATARFYIYTLESEGHRQTGIAGCASIDEYEANIVRRHEHTRPQKEDDRTRHVTTVRAQTGPVFLTYRGTDEIKELTTQVTAGAPLFDFVAEDGVSHSVWVVPEQLTKQMQAAFAAVPVLYIADGHHRAASAARAREAFRDQNPAHTGNEEYNRTLAVAFPGDQLRVLAYNRVVSGLNNHTPTEFLDCLRNSFEVASANDTVPQRPETFCMYLGGQWWLLSYRGDTSALPPVEQLDVSILQNYILSPLLGIIEPRSDDRIDFVGGIRGTVELEGRVDAGKADIAFSLYPTTVDQLMRISDRGETMPPKSTWFEPKLRDGLLVHEI